MLAGGVGIILGYVYAPSRSDWRRVLAYARRRVDRSAPASAGLNARSASTVRSCTSSHAFRSTPPPYPVSEPELPITR
jgi:hypothetical protein